MLIICTLIKKEVQSSMSQVDYSEKHRTERFLEELKSKLKGYPPFHYAVTVSGILDDTIKNPNLMSYWPPHYLIHSIEANCAYHFSYRQDTLDQNKLIRIMNFYKQYFDPVAKYFLTKVDDGLYPFLINMARQQFHLQEQFGKHNLGRAIYLFYKGNYKKSEELFKEKFGMNYTEWLIVGFGVFAGTHDKSPAMISPEYFLKADYKIANDNAVINFFKLISTTPEEVKIFFKSVREKIGLNIAPQYETYIQGIFAEKPLLKFHDNCFLVVHKPLLLKKIAEGIFDLSKSQGDFGNEFGKTFENYVEKLLLEYIPKEKIIAEKDLQKFTKEKVCDFIIVEKDFLYLIECKGTEYSSYIATINAMKKDNSTKKISSGIVQLGSTAKQIKNNCFQELLGDTKSKKLISSIITFKQLYLVNIKWYWENVTTSLINEELKREIESTFAYKPQILSISELEQLLDYSSKNSINYFEIFKEKLTQSESLTGDCSIFLKNDNHKVDLLLKTFDSFFKDNLLKVIDN